MGAKTFNMLNSLTRTGQRRCGELLLGGEPLDQAPAVLGFLEAAHKAGLDVLLYTGYELNELFNSTALR